MEKADCAPRTLSSDLGERTRTRKTQPRTSMHIRSARIANKEVNMSGECTPANPSSSSSQSTQHDPSIELPLNQAIDNLVRSVRWQRDQLRREVSIDSLRRAILRPISTPLPAISVIVTEGSLSEPQSTFVDTVESLSQSAI